MTDNPIANKVVTTMITAIDLLSDAELRELIRECSDMNKTNCWWVLYGVKDIIDEFATDTLNLRKEKAQAQVERKAERGE